MDSSGESYPWNLLRRTVFVLAGYLIYGMNVGIRGPTQLDLKDVYGVTVSDMSFVFLLNSIGSFIGCFGMGIIMDKLKRFQNLVITIQLVIFGLCTALQPFLPTIVWLYVISFIGGVGIGGFDVGGKVLVIDIWKGRDSGPYMNALVFSWSAGAFLVSFISRYFLANVDEEQIVDSVLSVIAKPNETMEILHNLDAIERVGELANTESIFTIQFLYPLVGALPVILSFAFIIYFISDVKDNKSLMSINEEERQEEKSREEKDKETQSTRLHFLLLVMMLIFFFVYVGLEHSFGAYISVFAVKCKLGLTRQQGSDLSAVFWGWFAGTRGLAVPVAFFVSHKALMVISFLCALVGASVICLIGEDNIFVLFVFTALFAFGLASIYSTGFVWLGERMVISNRIGSAIAISSFLGSKAFTVLTGHIVEEHPLTFMYIILACTAGCILLFITSVLISKKIASQKNVRSNTNNKSEIEKF